MEFTTVVAALLRRWYVVLAGLLLTTGLVYAATTAVPPTYSAVGSVLLLPPGASLEDGSNPLLALGGLEQPAALVVAYLAGDEAREAFAQQYPDATYDIVLDPLSRGPLVIVTVEDPSSDDVLAALNSVLDALPEALTQLQDEVAAPSESRIGSMPLSVDTEATTERSDWLRAVIAAAGVGIVLTLVGAVAFDSLALRRRARREAGAAAAAEAQAQQPPLPEPALARGPVTDDARSRSRVQLRDFARSEERYGSEWPPQAHEAPTRDDPPRVAPRA